MHLVFMTGRNSSVLCNGERVYKDSYAILDLLSEVYSSGERLYIHPRSEALFRGVLADPRFKNEKVVQYFAGGCNFIYACEDYCAKAYQYNGDCYCFVEEPYVCFDCITSVIKYERGTDYACDVFLQMDGMTLSSVEFVLDSGNVRKKRYVVPAGGRASVICSRC